MCEARGCLKRSHENTCPKKGQILLLQKCLQVSSESYFEQVSHFDDRKITQRLRGNTFQTTSLLFDIVGVVEKTKKNLSIFVTFPCSVKVWMSVLFH